MRGYRVVLCATVNPSLATPLAHNAAHQCSRQAHCERAWCGGWWTRMLPWSHLSRRPRHWTLPPPLPPLKWEAPIPASTDQRSKGKGMNSAHETSPSPRRGLPPRSCSHRSLPRSQGPTPEDKPSHHREMNASKRCEAATEMWLCFTHVIVILLLLALVLFIVDALALKAAGGLCENLCVRLVVYVRAFVFLAINLRMPVQE